MSQNDSEKYVLAAGATSNGFAEFNVAMFLALSAEVFSPAKLDDFPDL